MIRLAGIYEWTGEAVADTEQGLLVTDAEIGMGVMGKRGGLNQGHLSEDCSFGAIGAHRISAEGFLAAGAGRELEDVFPRTAADAELVAGCGAAVSGIGSTDSRSAATRTGALDRR